jgi:hypothetical protein
MEEKKRGSYGIEDKEVSFDSSDQESEINKEYDDLDGSLRDELKIFTRLFLRNEDHSASMFLDLSEKITEFQSNLDQNYYYNEMDIIKLTKEILRIYRLWAISLRQNIFLSKEKIKIMAKKVKKDYVSQEYFNRTMEEYNIQREIEEHTEVAEVKISKDRELLIRVKDSGKTFSPIYEKGDLIYIRKKYFDKENKGGN